MKKEKEAIERLQAFSAEEPYYLCYSGGKDSDTIRILAELANVNFEVHNNHTTVDTGARAIRDIAKAKNGSVVSAARLQAENNRKKSLKNTQSIDKPMFMHSIEW